MTNRLLFLLTFLTVAALLGSGFYLQYYDGFMPCPLCTMQRLSFAAVGIMALIGFLFHRRRLITIPSSLFVVLFSVAGFFFAARQTWLQLFPSAESSECGVSLEYMMQVLPLHEVMSKILAGSTECSDKTWSLLTLTMPEWSMICFSILFCVGGIVLIRACRNNS